MEKKIKPWGCYQVLFKGSEFQVKRVVIMPGRRLSLQKHRRRSETWMVVEGSGVATVGTKKVRVRRGSVVKMNVLDVHRMHNTGRKPLIFIEVQLGRYLEEDDIIRLEDDYDRTVSH